MKRPFIFLIMLMVYCAFGFGLGMPFAIWLSVKDSTGINFVNYVFFGAFFGAFCGVIIWLMYRFNLHK
ncbi:hypothetical protein BIY28_08605 [Brenneria goodwinii]|nr:hypothetical protein BIY28_08605 [Brenneria goodwinii]